MKTLIEKIVSIALVLASLGQLKSATLWLMKEAAKNQPRMMSLGKLNRVLIGEPRHQRMKK